MPGRRANSTIDAALCRRCQLIEPTITVRTEPLCRPCFCKYVSTKAIKRMESFRVRHSGADQERTLLLPLSFGAGSTTLLYVLDQHLKGQVERTGRTGFQLRILHVDEAASPSVARAEESLEKVKQRFPDHSYCVSSLSDILFQDDVSFFTVAKADGNEREGEEVANEKRLDLCLNSLDSATSRADVTEILKRKLIVRAAEENACEAILWGDSTTRLAERTLAETAKGRGFALPWMMSNGESPHGIPSYYPMRELLSKEILAFASLVDQPLDDLILNDEAKPAVNMRSTTIDDLMKQYFESVEREYPSIVANVVRTASKLKAPPLKELEQQCELCDMPLDDQAPARSRLCYGCIRTLPKAVV